MKGGIEAPMASRSRMMEPIWKSKRGLILLIVLILNIAIFLTTRFHVSPPPDRHQLMPGFADLEALASDSHDLHRLIDFQQCSIDNFQATGLPFLKGTEPIAIGEFADRRDRLAKALVEDGYDAFIAEPGSTFEYYVNITQSNWGMSERPFLMVIRPIEDANGKVSANTTFLVPAFEANRARLLDMALDGPITIIEWQEHWSPYGTLASSTLFKDFKTSPKVVVDAEIRDFIQRGLGQNGFEVSGLGGNVEAVRQTKSAVEISLLRAVNTATAEAVRQMRKCLYPGLTERQILVTLLNTLQSGGMEADFSLVLFDEHAANPHGGWSEVKTLGADTLILIDVGARLYGYSSDVTRTFFPPFLPDTDKVRQKLQEKLKVWDLVYEAQTAAIKQLKAGNTAASVDVAARDVISAAGYGDAFTHRLGHSIGLDGHEAPYLNQGNVNTTLRAGMAFTAEPGIYLVGNFGVRHEDVYVISADGEEAECMSGKRTGGPWNP